jgi:hypothetical protein
MEKSFVEFDVSGWREMIKNCLAIYYKLTWFNVFFLLNIMRLCNSKIVIFSRKLSTVRTKVFLLFLASQSTLVIKIIIITKL